MAKKRSSGFGTTLVLALVIVVLSAALGAALSNFNLLGRIPVVGPFLFEEQPARTTTGPVVVEGIRDLNQLTTVRWRETVIITREESGTELERIFSGEEVTVLAAGEILAQAEQNAENSISAFVTSLGFEEVEFVN